MANVYNKLSYVEESYLKISHRGRSVCINPREWSRVIQNIPSIEKVLKTPKMLDDPQTLFMYLSQNLTLRVETVGGENRVALYARISCISLSYLAWVHLYKTYPDLSNEVAAIHT